MMAILKKIVGRHIREVREMAGYGTIDAFAAALDVHPNSVGELERGSNWISPEMLEKLMALLKMPPAAFFPGADPSLSVTPDEREILDIFRSLNKLQRDALLTFLKGTIAKGAEKRRDPP